MGIDFNTLIRGFGRILRQSAFVSSKKIKRVVLLFNPSAGGFTDHEKALGLLDLLEKREMNTNSPNWEIEIRECIAFEKGDLKKAVLALDDLEPESTFLISLGGDGTHQEVLSTVLLLSPAVKNLLWIFRFPAGTGNDAADAWTQEQAIHALAESLSFGKLGAIRIQLPGRQDLWSFNIASLGIDAYVVHLNNSLQKFLPGNFYRLFSDLGVLFYGIIHGYKTMRIQRFGAGNKTSHEERKNAIMALGVSGFRTYGNEKWVLPDERNYCSILKGGVIQNLKFKKKLFQAKHPELESCTMDLTRRIRVEYPGKILMQLDGEVFPLYENDFPLFMETVETPLTYLSAKEPSTQKAVLLHPEEERNLSQE